MDDQQLSVISGVHEHDGLGAFGWEGTGAPVLVLPSAAA